MESGFVELELPKISLSVVEFAQPSLTSSQLDDGCPAIEGFDHAPTPQPTSAMPSAIPTEYEYMCVTITSESNTIYWGKLGTSGVTAEITVPEGR